MGLDEVITTPLSKNLSVLRNSHTSFGFGLILPYKELRWAGNIARVGERRYSYRTLVGKL